jgi:hypothetical protein
MYSNPYLIELPGNLTLRLLFLCLDLLCDPTIIVSDYRFPALPDFLRSLEWGPLSLIEELRE